MGFKFYRRIKLGKGLGLNASKSGIRASYRNKRGSINSKGYSIRTGIPGLSYGKSFGKRKSGGGMKVLFSAFLFSVFSIVTSCINEINNKEGLETNKWYEGGTLHRAKVKKWKASTETNKLATCADFCANIYKSYSLYEIKVKATSLKACINEAVKGDSLTDESEVSEIASMCLILLEN